MDTPPPDAAQGHFVELWGSMSSLWGVNPTVARLHGYLFIVGGALTTDELMAGLGISRGNVSMSVKTLLEWGLVRRVHRPGDRRDRYESVRDGWEMFTRVAAERKRREIDPLVAGLRRCRQEMTGERAKLVEDLLTILQTLDALAVRFFASQENLKAAVALLAAGEHESPRVAPRG